MKRKRKVSRKGDVHLLHELHRDAPHYYNHTLYLLIRERLIEGIPPMMPDLRRRWRVPIPHRYYLTQGVTD